MQPPDQCCVLQGSQSQPMRGNLSQKQRRSPSVHSPGDPVVPIVEASHRPFPWTTAAQAREELARPIQLACRCSLSVVLGKEHSPMSHRETQTKHINHGDSRLALQLARPLVRSKSTHVGAMAPQKRTRLCTVSALTVDHTDRQFYYYAWIIFKSAEIDGILLQTCAFPTERVGITTPLPSTCSLRIVPTRSASHNTGLHDTSQ